MNNQKPLSRIRQHFCIAVWITGATVGLQLVGGSLSPAEGSSSSDSKPSKADAAWVQLFGANYQVDPPVEFESAAHFITSIEQYKQRLRRLGIRFWQDYPDDPRRYEWLLVAANLAPVYPADIDDFRSSLSHEWVYGGAINQTEIDKWKVSYDLMRSQFNNAKDVTDDQRQYLRFAEIQSDFEGLRRKLARGETIDATQFVGDVLALASERVSTTESPIDRYVSLAWLGLLKNVADCDSSFGIDTTEFGQFVAQLTANTNLAGSWETAIRMSRSADNRYKKGIIDRCGNDRRVSDALSKFQFMSWLDQPDTDPGRLVFSLDQIEIKAKFRNLGLANWESLSHVERVQWLSESLRWSNRAGVYMNPLGSGLWSVLYGEQDDQIRIEVDRRLYSAWIRDYQAKLEYLQSSPETTDEQRGRLAARDVWYRFWNLAPKTWVVDGNHQPVIRVLEDIHRLVGEYEVEFEPRRLTAELIRDPSRWGVDSEQLEAFLRPMLESKYPHKGMRLIAEGWFSTQELSSRPLDFSAPTLDGEAFNVADLRGSIVLLDFWTTTCSACIAAMPLIHEIYEEYRDRGFEVVSVNFDADRNRKKVERIEKELGLAWTTLNAESQWEEANVRFGWGNILPVYMLLDRRGRLVAGTEEVDYGKNLKSLLDEMLAAEATENEAATIL